MKLPAFQHREERGAVRRIKIIHVVRTLATGGMENIVRKLLDRLDAEVFEQKVCTLITSAKPPHEETICLNRATKRLEFLVPQLARVFMREKPDIVHSRNWAAIEAVLAARLCRVPAIVHSEHGRDLQTLGRQPFRRRVLRRLSYGWADRLFCVSQELKDYYCGELQWGASKFEVVPNGVDTEQFRPDQQARVEIRGRVGAGAKTMVVGTVGRLDPVKDHISLFRAAKMALGKGLDLRLVIVGDGIQRASLDNELARSADLARNTVFTGDVRNVAQWVNGFDVFVLPSLSEGLSNTLLEAMAVGVPPIATAVGGNLEVIEDGHSGLLVRPQDPETMSRYLLELAGDELRREQLARNARDRVRKQFSLDRMLKRYADMYFQLMEPAKKGTPVFSRA